MDSYQLVANWVPGPILAILVLFLVKREATRTEKVLEELRANGLALTAALAAFKDKLNEIALMSRDFITVKSHGESTTRVYDEMRKGFDELKVRILTLELTMKRNGDKQ